MIFFRKKPTTKQILANQPRPKDLILYDRLYKVLHKYANFENGQIMVAKRWEDQMLQEMVREVTKPL